MRGIVHPGWFVAFSEDADPRTNAPIPTPARLCANHRDELSESQEKYFTRHTGNARRDIHPGTHHYFENRVILHEFVGPSRQECEESCETRHHHN
jgi:alpha/beta superfamily hydrolase